MPMSKGCNRLLVWPALLGSLLSSKGNPEILTVMCEMDHGTVA
jgi:hypothetical protein